MCLLIRSAKSAHLSSSIQFSRERSGPEAVNVRSVAVRAVPEAVAVVHASRHVLKRVAVRFVALRPQIASHAAKIEQNGKMIEY